ncbi:Bgt-51758 [Blumeria graminis f. sp. tritici]|uniref:Bgt-51758 n=1 Tax=Blumeria graminis f. sp. tritici TaxID=62690 RepID=A0A9X9MJE4_BLUGR|nr:Bgt-51758 [Blumeria graminis f. sp. tritici]
MNANLVLALLSKHPHLMYIELAVVTPISPSIANLSYIPKAASLPFSYLVIVEDQKIKVGALNILTICQDLLGLGYST